MLKNQVMHKVIHIIHMEKHVDELIYIMGITFGNKKNIRFGYCYENVKFDRNRQKGIDFYKIKIL